MNWYRLLKLAAPQTKIQSLGITEPYMQALIYKYENMFPWQSIKNIDDFTEFLKDFVSSLKSEFESVENDEKKNILMNWYDTMIGYFAPGTKFDNAQFILVALPLLDWVKKHDAPPPAISVANVTTTLHSIAANPSSPINFLKTYVKSFTPVEREDGWHEFSKVKNNTPEELYAFTYGTGWCTGSRLEYAQSYLNYYRIDILVKNGVPVVAIVANFSDALHEVRGRFNSVPYEYREEALKKVEELGYYTGYANTYFLLEKVPKLNEMLDKNMFDSFKYFRTCLNLTSEVGGDNDIYDVYGALSNENKKRDDVVEEMKEKTQSRIILSSPIKVWNQTPKEQKEELKDIFIQALNKSISTGHLFSKKSIPEEILPDIDTNKLKEQATRMLSYYGSRILGTKYMDYFDLFTDEEASNIAYSLLKGAELYTIDRTKKELEKVLGASRTSKILDIVNSRIKEEEEERRQGLERIKKEKEQFIKQPEQQKEPEEFNEL